MLRTITAPLLILALLLPMVACNSSGSGTAKIRGTLIESPPPIDITGLEKSRVEKAIVGSLPKRGWEYLGKQGQTIDASIFVRGKHTAVISIDYGSDEILIDYVDSTNLDYQQVGDLEYIHKNYNTWVGLLRQDIAVSVSSLRY
ncbi:MAG: hypothetical protein AAF663_05525 [Planctomycetota bacterium]